ncbi:DUF397 domain-containing protein [Streptomyces sp. NPDC048420]|uniref:DUF397 domain-containing protein n=1 Tax=Streptomyces sp. NPDC048420 TaxID=3155755 RepID=UPI003443446F
MQTLHWQKSTYSGDSSNCVEIAATLTAIHVRDSKITEGPHLAFPATVWIHFISQTTFPTSPLQDPI